MAYGAVRERLAWNKKASSFSEMRAGTEEEWVPWSYVSRWGNVAGEQTQWLVFSVCENTSIPRGPGLWRLGRWLGRRPEERSVGPEGALRGMDEAPSRAQLLEGHTCWDLSHRAVVEVALPGMLPSLPVTNICIVLVIDLT